jgi:thiosulfate reductase cytochrome b subunit
MRKLTRTGCGKRRCIFCWGVRFSALISLDFSPWLDDDWAVLAGMASNITTSKAEVNGRWIVGMTSQRHDGKSRCVGITTFFARGQRFANDVCVYAMTDAVIAAPAPEKPLRRMHPAAVRVMHWTNAVAMAIMIGSGWKIYNDEVLFGWLHFPDTITIGGEAQGALQWHFAAMWLLFLNGLVYLCYGLFTGRFKRLLLPVWPRVVIADIRAALAFRLAHDDLTKYNAVQRLLYLGIILVIVVQVLSGLAIWKPVQFQELTALFYDFQGARVAHFIGMALIVGFLIVHIALALLVPRTLVAMVTGGPAVKDDGTRAEPTATPADTN